MIRSKDKTIKEVEDIQPKTERKPSQPLGFCMVVVNDGQASSVVRILNENETAAAFILHGAGTSTSDFYDVLGLGNPKKQIICSLIRISKWKNLKESLNARLRISKSAQGIAWFTPITTLAGLSAYKYFSNSRGLPRDEEVNMPDKKNYEAIFAIVNDGYTDLVVEASRSAGAKGGTVITARGTGNKEFESFYGVAITPEKQIVMILVPKEIRDDVLTAINRAVGFATKGQGIAFAVPVGDVVGLAEEQKEAE